MSHDEESNSAAANKMLKIAEGLSNIERKLNVVLMPRLEGRERAATPMPRQSQLLDNLDILIETVSDIEERINL